MNIRASFWKISTYEQKIDRIKIFFHKYVDIKEGCWGWNGTKLNNRGRLYFELKAIQAHRVSWMIHFGKIPIGMYVCHKCDNELCTNPNHLYLGTAQQNTRDAFATGMNFKKLTVDMVRDIKIHLVEGIKSTEIAKKYNVTASTICDIRKNRIWSWI